MISHSLGSFETNASRTLTQLRCPGHDGCVQFAAVIPSIHIRCSSSKGSSRRNTHAVNAVAQDKSVNHVVATIKKQLAAARDNPEEPSRVFVISTYVIGKERILLAVRQLCCCALHRSGGLRAGAQLL